MTRLSLAILPLGLAAGMSLGTAAAAQDEAALALATLKNADGEEVGSVEFTGGPNGVLVKALIDGVTPGEHGFHIHETGDCGDGFEAAGDHLAGGGSEHGFLNPNGPHAGDMPNFIAGADGTATTQVFATGVTLGDGDASLLDEDGSAVIVHENPDTYAKEAGAGGRIACGVIEARG